jgi:hypothetical protein
MTLVEHIDEQNGVENCEKMINSNCMHQEIFFLLRRIHRFIYALAISGVCDAVKHGCFGADVERQHWKPFFLDLHKY